MPNDVLALGPFAFEDFAVPDTLPGGGKHQLKVHKMPGGDRVVDCMGPDDDDRTFTVVIVSSDAMDQCLTLDAMRIQGGAWPYSNGMEARVVVIAACTWTVEKFPNVIHVTLTLTPADNPAGPQGASGASDDQQNQDLDSANATASDNAANSPSTPGSGTGATAGTGAALPQTAPLPPERPATFNPSIGPGGIGHA